ncbi:MAG TPA: sensor histidine kinase, partial [Polyangiaceae bacterium]
FRQREHVDWFRDPLRKLLLLLVGVLFGTVPVTVGMLALWYRLAGFAHPDWAAIEVVTLTNVICVVFVTHVYETVFLIKERESDLVRVAELERARAEAELEALRAQIDPHFLFNCLNALGQLAMEDPRRARAFTEKLARVYRYILASRGRPLVLLREELSFASDYLGLLGERFGDALHVRIEAPDELRDRRLLPPISLQLLLENAVKHNEVSAEAPLDVRLTVEGEEVRVWNAKRPKLDVGPSAKVGLKNLSERCQRLAERGLRVEEDDSAFTVALPLLPVR